MADPVIASALMASMSRRVTFMEASVAGATILAARVALHNQRSLDDLPTLAETSEHSADRNRPAAGKCRALGPVFPQ
jgi:hypothetical protein